MTVAEIRMHPHFEPLGIYAIGFLESAHVIFERADSGRGRVDYAFYPGAYCIRHGLELFAKQISIFSAYIHEDVGRLYVLKHYLDKAWGPAREFIEWGIDGWDLGFGARDEDGESLRDAIAVIEGVVEDLHELDPDGMRLRYPESISRKEPRERLPQPPPFEHVNLGDWKAAADAALGAVCTLLSLAQEWASDERQCRGHPPVGFHDLVIQHYAGDNT